MKDDPHEATILCYKLQDKGPSWGIWSADQSYETFISRFLTLKHNLQKV